MATIVEGVAAGDVVDVDGGVPVVAVEAIPAGHKVALADVEPGGQIVKYGEPIGVATRSIRRGGLVHVHNVASQRGRGDLGR